MLSALDKLYAKAADLGSEALPSARYTLPGRAALTISSHGEQDDILANQLERIWRSYSTAKDRAKNDIKALPGASGSEDAARRGPLFGILLQRAIDAPQANFATACGLAEELKDGRYPPPAEILFLLELHRFHKDRLASLEWPVISKALTVRRMAEEA